MREPEREGDLVVLVADADTRETVDSILSRPRDLGIRSIAYRIERHPNLDPGCPLQSVEFLRKFLRGFRHTLVVFDYEGCGSREPPRRVRDLVTDDLERNGWKGRAHATVIAPELEIWAWGDPTGLAGVLGWDGPSLRRFMAKRCFGVPGGAKPHSPKTAFRQMVLGAPAASRKSPSSRLFGQLAAVARLDGCRDPAFRDLRRALRAWFPLEPSGAPRGRGHGGAAVRR